MSTLFCSRNLPSSFAGCGTGPHEAQSALTTWSAPPWSAQGFGRAPAQRPRDDQAPQGMRMYTSTVALSKLTCGGWPSAGIVGSLDPSRGGHPKVSHMPVCPCVRSSLSQRAGADPPPMHMVSFPPSISMSSVRVHVNFLGLGSRLKTKHSPLPEYFSILLHTCDVYAPSSSPFFVLITSREGTSFPDPYPYSAASSSDTR
mmetsp:Transcript_57527/g.141057  ORF Transcript_57527/g.141057 Transcript_57527/m.141057 type:complete len:201 (+) Transcript_57527:197-799(+)|eukprot:CAMPEP_0206241142 /NCGR_PEP_ID=MMETSP0047_2-20121206/16337_1 /ASSEMBLY_ACC=CAM_ASM_000192 /TAXON_ID=195065 /ORGANISM="Chroomonas mesostigmatica_cf, Strain CCMP1168" /LENGTH=200 /DNA_ID=CAMNT_0053666017 /DNA_START=93 /DNA_END=695 /DNA_ORIENTATION=+